MIPAPTFFDVLFDPVFWLFALAVFLWSFFIVPRSF